MSSSSKRRLARARESLALAGQPFGDWLTVLVRDHLDSDRDGGDLPSDYEILARHWGVSTAEAEHRVRLHGEFLAVFHSDLWAGLQEPYADLETTIIAVHRLHFPDSRNFVTHSPRIERREK